jgi:hypothetical protein
MACGVTVAFWTVPGSSSTLCIVQDHSLSESIEMISSLVSPSDVQGPARLEQAQASIHREPGLGSGLKPGLEEGM